MVVADLEGDDGLDVQDEALAQEVEPMPEVEQRRALEAGGIREAVDEERPAPRRRAARKRPAS